MPSSSSSGYPTMGYPFTNLCSDPSSYPGSGSGWVSWPPATGTDFQSYCYLIQLYQAIRERYWCLGRGAYPLRFGNTSWGYGVITAITDNGDGTLTITDSGANWADGTGSCSGHKFAGYSCDGSPWIPSDYDVMIELGQGPLPAISSSSSTPEREPNHTTDYRRVFRTHINDNTTTTLNVEDTLKDYVTAGYVTSLSDFVGGAMWMIRTGGYWWADVGNPDLQRWPVMPNSWEYIKGTGSGNIGDKFIFTKPDTNPPDGSPPSGWTVPPFNYDLGGLDLLVYGNDGYLKRLDIYGIDNDTIWLHAKPSSSSGGSSSSSTSSSSSGTNLSGQFVVVENNAAAMPERDAWHPFWWYGGAIWDQRNAVGESHDPTDAFSEYKFPVDNVIWEELDCTAGPESCHCRDYNHPCDSGPCPTYGALDLDLWTDFDADCTPYDESFAPYLWRTLRSLQNEIINLAPSFIEKKSYSGYQGTTIPPLEPARMFELDSTNAYRTTITCVGGYCGCGSSSSSGAGPFSGDAKLAAAFPVALEGTSFDCFFAVYDSNSVLMASGAGTYSSGGTVGGSSSSSSSGAAGPSLSGSGITTDHCGMTVVISLAWDRYIPREFLYMFPKCCFVPDDCPDGLGGFNISYPPAPCNFCCEDPDTNPGPVAEVDCCKDCSGVGVWYNRDISLTYCEADEFGMVLPGAFNFIAGEYARYVGDNWNHPFDGREVWTGQDDDAKRTWYDHFFRGQLKSASQESVTLQRQGQITDGGTFYLTDASKDWWDLWHATGSNRTDTGTATGGSTTTLIDTTKNAASPDYPDGIACFWSEDRFAGFGGGIWKQFILEVNFSGVWIKRPITNGVAATQTLTVSPAFPGSTSGKQYRIREPKGGELNRWKGRKLRLYPIPCFGSSSSSGNSHGASSSSSGGDLAYYEVTITYSDDKTLFWDASESVAAEACWRYEIIEPEYGTVWKFSTTQPTDGRRWFKIATGKYWVQPRGADATRLGVTSALDFHEDQRENLPTVVKRYGPMRKGDYVNTYALTQMYKAINRLRWTKIGVTWSSRNDLNSDLSGGTAQNNHIEWEGTGAEAYLCAEGDDCCPYWPRLQGFVDDALAAYPTPPTSGTITVTEATSSAPRKEVLVGTGMTVTFSDKNATYAYAYVVGIPTIIACDADLYTYTDYLDDPYDESCPEDLTLPDCVTYPPYSNTTDNINGSYWDDFGDPVLQSAWEIWNTADFGGPLKTPIRHSDIIGSWDTLQGEWPDPMPCFQDGCDPASCNADEICPTDCNVERTCDFCQTSNNKGYIVENQFAILKWDVAGGLTFVD